jgi:hypothetical protein
MSFKISQQLVDKKDAREYLKVKRYPRRRPEPSVNAEQAYGNRS